MFARWDSYFMNIAEQVAKLSKDESTKLGAVIVGPDCARAIVQVGVTVVVVRSFDVPERWKDDMDVAYQILAEGGVVIREMLKAALEV